MKKKIIIGIIIGVVVILIGVLTYGEVTGKFSIFGRNVHSGEVRFGDFRFPDIADNVTVETSNGTLYHKDAEGDSAPIDYYWESVRFTDNSDFVLSVMRYVDVQMDTIMADREGYSEVNITSQTDANQTLTYEFLELQLDDGIVQDQYYTYMFDNTYLFIATFKDTTANREKLTSFLETLVVEEETNSDPIVVEPTSVPTSNPGA